MTPLQTKRLQMQSTAVRKYFFEIELITERESGLINRGNNDKEETSTYLHVLVTGASYQSL